MFKAEYFFARILLPFIIGIGIFYFFSSWLLLKALGISCLLCFCILLFANIYYKKLKIYRFKGSVGLLIFIFFFILGGFLCLLNNEKLKQNYFANKNYNTLKIWVNNEPQKTNDILRFKANVVSGYQNNQQVKLSGQLLLALKLDSIKPIQLKYGDELIVGVKYLAVEPSYNPAEFDFRAWLASQNIYQQAFINQDHVYKTNKNNGNFIIKFALNLREKQIAKYRILIKNNDAFAVASTLILGYRADLNKETLSTYSKTGTIHALSVSGAHVAIIYFILDYALLFLNRKRALQILKLLLICCLIWSYALITGLSPSVVRATTMITIFIFAKTFSKNKNSYNVLAFCAFFQLLINPYIITNVGFQLSYLAVFGLIYLQPIIYNSIYVKNKWLDKFWKITTISLAAQIITFPLSIFYFHQFPIYFLLGNLFIMLPLSLMMYLGIIVLIPGMEFLAKLLEWTIVFTNLVLKWIADLPLSTYSSIWINLPEFILLSLALAFVLIAFERKNKKFIFISTTLFILYQSFVVYDEIKIAEQNKVIFYSLRKNYAVAFINKNSAIIETDLLPTENNYLFFVKPSLEQMQIKDIVFLNLNQDTILHNFIKKDNQIVYQNQSYLIIDENFNYKNIKSVAKFNSIWLHKNTKFDLNRLNEQITYNNIIIDASNKDYKIANFKDFAIKNRYPVHILKKNAAYLIDLNP